MLQHFGRRALAVVVVMALARGAVAQQVNVGTPYGNGGHSFYENIGLGWGMSGNGWSFNFPGPVAPPFGGGGTGGGASFGGGFGGGGFRLTAEQGASRSFSSQSPSVTVMNGGMGYFSDTQIRPFVTGLVPVVGNMPTAPPLLPMVGNEVNPVHERLGRLAAEGPAAAAKARAADVEEVDAAADKPLVLGGGGGGGFAASESSAARGDLSIAEIKARQAAAASQTDSEVAALMLKAETALADGKSGVAKVYYQMAARRATGDQQREVAKKLQELEAK